MGFKIRAGMAVGGMALSYFFGLSFLSGLAGQLDTTGNILVDIADGIGLVSKGIEALESYIDPSTVAEPEKPAIIDKVEVPVQPPEVVATTVPPPKPIICKKGKCAPYDPSKDKVLQQQLIRAERERILQQFQSGALPAEALIPAAQLFNDDDLEEDEMGNAVAKRLRAAAAQQQREKPKEPIKSSEAATQPIQYLQPTEPKPSQTPQPAEPKPPQPEILDPTNPQLEVDQSKNEISSPWKFGAKKVLSSVNVVCQRLKTLLLKVVTKVFPWNRRAKRRLSAAKGGDDALEEDY